MSWCVNFPEDLPVAGGCVVAIGNFDGVHAGHRHLLGLAKADAAYRSLPLVVLTFEPHPRSVLRPEVVLKRLSTPEQKVALLHAAGVDGVAVLPFDLSVAAMTPERFIQEVLVDWLGAVGVCVGENFRFGNKALGNTETLRAAGLDVVAVSLHEDEFGVVSSSRLRGA